MDRLLGEWGIRWDQPGAGRQFAKVMEARRQAERDEEFKPLNSDWCFGSEQFRAEMLNHIERQRGKWHYGSELWESAQAKAEHLIAEALRSEGVPDEQLGRWRKGHPFKIELAAKLRTQTTVTLDWIAQRLQMGTRGHLAHLLYLYSHERVNGQRREIPARAGLRVGGDLCGRPSGKKDGDGE